MNNFYKVPLFCRGIFGQNRTDICFCIIISLVYHYNSIFRYPRYVNYRDSKLTRLLREVLGGRCRTAMVAHVAAGGNHRDTTRSTLHYAQRASSITNRVKILFYSS